jgi:hypothetical protein|nr:MAG TPA: hypothetical protein [Caudoviricetes sp.]
MFNRIKTVLKQGLSLALAVAVTVAVPVTAFAAGGLGVNADSDGGVAAGNDPNYAAKFHAYPQNQGIRLSIVDKNGDRVANSVDIVNYVPSRLLSNFSFGSGSEVVSNRYSGSETEIGKYTSRFIDWIGWRKGGNKRERFQYSNGIKTEPYTGISWSNGVDSGVAPHNGRYGVIQTVMIPRAEFNHYLGLEIEYRSGLIGKSVKRDSLDALLRRMTIPSYLNSDGNFLPGGVALKKAFAANVEYTDGSQSDVNVATYLLDFPVPLHDNKGNIAIGGMSLFELLPSAPGKEKINTTKADGTKYGLADAMIEYKYSLIVEPIYWYVPEILTTNPERIAQKGTLHENYINAVTYGTASYISKFAYEELKENRYPDSVIHDCSVGPDWGTGSLGITTMMVDKDDTDLGVYQCQGAHTIDYTPNSNLWSLYSLGANNNAKENGYSVFIFKGEFFKPKTPATHTFDSKNYGSSSGNGYHRAPAPDPNNDPLSDPTQDPNPNKKIVKIYARKAGANSFIYEDTQIRVNTVSPIKIEDEEEYTVDNWFTSNVDKFPSSGNGSAGVNDYGAIKGSIPNKQTGTGTTTTSLEDNDVLYVRLVYDPVWVVKVYEDADGNQLKPTTVEKIKRVPNYNGGEGGYIIDKTRTTEGEPFNGLDGGTPWSSVITNTSGNDGNSEVIPVPESHHTIYIHYTVSKVEETAPLKLMQSEIAHTFKLSDLAVAREIKHTWNIPDEHGTMPERSHYDDDGDEHIDHYECHWYSTIVDADWAFNIRNNFNYGATSFAGTDGEFKTIETGRVSDEGSSRALGFVASNGLAPNMQFTVYRDKAKDRLTAYPNGLISGSSNHQNNEGLISKIGVDNVSAVYGGGRLLPESSAQYAFNDSFKTLYQYVGKNDPIRKRRVQNDRGHYHGPIGLTSYTASEVPNLAYLNALYSRDNNVIAYGFVGNAGKGAEKSSAGAGAFGIFGQNYNLHNSYAADGKQFIEFFPYHKMYFQKSDTYDHSSAGNESAFITSSNTSSVLDNFSVETGVYNSKGSDNAYGISLASEQWSIHERAKKVLEANGIRPATENLLPGGATIELRSASTDKANTPEVWVGFRTLQVSIPDELKATLVGNDKDSVKTTSVAKADGAKFYNDMVSTLEKYQVEKWVDDGIRTAEPETKVSGINPVQSFGGNNLQNGADSKYYLKVGKTDGNGAQMSVVDKQIATAGTNTGVFEQHVYRIYGDLTGDVLHNGLRVVVTKDGQEIASTNITSSADTGDGLLGNSEVRNVNERTKFVTNFVKSLDKARGSDRNGVRWYYEAQDGIEVVETLGRAQLGFTDGNGKPNNRSEVADTKLSGKLESHGDIISGDKDKTRTVQYRMSAAPMGSDKAYYIGSFNGVDITVNGLNDAFKSRLYYMSNNTVMDLN